MEGLMEILGFKERAALNVETWTWLACPISMW